MFKSLAIYDRAAADSTILATEFPEKEINNNLYKAALLESQQEKFDFDNPDVIVKFIDDLSNMYKTLGEGYFAHNRAETSYHANDVFIDSGISKLFLTFPGIYDKNSMYMFKSPDMVANKVNSNFTFVVDIAARYIMKHLSEKENVNNIRESIMDLFNTTALTFAPDVVAELLEVYLEDEENVIEGNKHKSKNDTPSVSLIDLIFDDKTSAMKMLFENLVVREGIILASNNYAYKFDPDCETEVGFKSSDLVFDKLGKYIIKDPEDILDDHNRNNWWDTILSNSVYTSYRMDLFTRALLNCTVFGTGNEDSVIKATRFIRKQVTDWIKHKNLDERPRKPECFEYISMPTFMRYLYTYGVYHVGDIEYMVNKFDQTIEKFEKEIKEDEAGAKALKEELEKREKEGNTDPVEAIDYDSRLKEATENLEKTKASKKHYLTLKSLIAFLFEECISNEKISQMVFNFDTLLNILVFEPGVDNAMHDTYNGITSLYVKRDFRPMGFDSINPYFMHYGIGDVLNENTKYLARLYSGLVHTNNSSRVAMAPVYSFDEAVNVLNMVTISKARTNYANNYNIFKSYQSLSRDLSSMYYSFESYKPEEDKKYARFEDIKKYINSETDKVQENLLSYNILDITDKLEDDLKFLTAHYKYGGKPYAVEQLEEVIKSVKFVEKSYQNILGVYDKVISKFDDSVQEYQGAKILASNCRANGKKFFSLWPHIIQDSYPIDPAVDNTPRSIEEVHHENFMDLEPGDIDSGRYSTPFERLGDRFSTTKGCD